MHASRAVDTLAGKWSMLAAQREAGQHARLPGRDSVLDGACVRAEADYW